MTQRILSPLAILVMLAALAGCNGQVAHPNRSSQNGMVDPSPGSAYNPISGTSAQD